MMRGKFPKPSNLDMSQKANRKNIDKDPLDPQFSSLYIDIYRAYLNFPYTSSPDIPRVSGFPQGPPSIRKSDFRTCYFKPGSGPSVWLTSEDRITGI